MPSLSVYIHSNVLSQNFVCTLTLKFIKKKIKIKKKRKLLQFRDQIIKPTISCIISFPRQPARKERFLHRVFSFLPPPFEAQQKKNPSLNPTRILRFMNKSSHLTLNFLLHQAERMLIKFLSPPFSFSPFSSPFLLYPSSASGMPLHPSAAPSSPHPAYLAPSQTRAEVFHATGHSALLRSELLRAAA